MVRSGGDIIRKLREEKGWSQEKLAEEADLSRPYVGALERGDRKNPRSAVIERIANALELDEESDERVLLRNGFFPALMAEPDAGDKQLQETADRVWVFSSKPAEVRREGGDYQEVLKNNLKRGVEYVYWTTSPARVESAVGWAKQELENEEDIEDLVECVVPPVEANFFNFAIYWFGEDQSFKEPEGRISLPGDEPEGPFQWSVSIDNESRKRIVDRCEEIIDILRLRVERGVEAKYQGYEWYNIEL